VTSLGLLTVRARFAGQAVDQLAVQLVRPPVTKLFIGQNPEAVVKTVPYLYTLCAHAQRAAAQAALAVAADEVRRPVDDGELWIEFLHENLWRLLLDWPQALGLSPAKEAFAAWRAARQGPDRVSETQALLAGALHEMAGHCLERLGGVDVETVHGGLPELQPEPWLAYWQGCNSEVPPTRRPSSLAAAYRARLSEVRQAAAGLAGNQPYPIAAAGGDGWGVGQTQTARGVLTHAVHVEDGQVMNYRVWAPTDCHFADVGALAGLLAGRHFADAGTARRGLDQAVLALDPCLPYVLELNDA
jgi:uptake hydrogenase large subunit